MQCLSYHSMSDFDNPIREGLMVFCLVCFIGNVSKTWLCTLREVATAQRTAPHRPDVETSSSRKIT